MKKLLGALVIAVLAMVLSAPPAEAARCWWNGYSWVCKKHRPHVRHWSPYRPYAYHTYRPYYYRPYYSHRPYYSYRPYYHRPRAYACVWPYC
jgi:hypothetical protein